MHTPHGPSQQAASPASGIPPTVRARGFTLLELYVSLALLAIGFIGLTSLMVRQSRQIARLETWCTPDRTYYVVGQTDPWMCALRAPAELAETAGETAWSPPVSGEKDNTVTLLSYSRQGQTMSAQALLDPSGE